MKRAPTPVTTLNAAEQRMVAAFRASDDYSQDICTVLMEAYARDRPRRTAPVLRIVGGGVK